MRQRRSSGWVVIAVLVLLFATSGAAGAQGLPLEQMGGVWQWIVTGIEALWEPWVNAQDTPVQVKVGEEEDAAAGLAPLTPPAEPTPSATADPEEEGADTGGKIDPLG